MISIASFASSEMQPTEINGEAKVCCTNNTEHIRYRDKFENHLKTLCHVQYGL